MTHLVQKVWPLLAALSLLGACSGGASVGGGCVTDRDCASNLQCLEAVCAPLCISHAECGDGYICAEAGECALVASRIGDECNRELDCGPGQHCKLEAFDSDGDGFLASECAEESVGTTTGTGCAADGDCRQGTCALGLCTPLCAIDSDCPSAFRCSEIPRLLPASAPSFRGCLPETGSIELTIPLSLTAESIRIPVPSAAISFALVSEIDDPSQFVGVTRLESPSGELLHVSAETPEQFFANPIRYQPAPSVSTLFVPNTTQREIEVGAYRADVASMRPPRGVGTEVPRVTVVYKIDDGATLDLNLIFLNLAEDPCSDAPLSAQAAASNADFQRDFLNVIREIFASAGITVGIVTYADILDRPDLDGLDATELGSLLELAGERTGMNIFFVRTIDPVGVQALAGGIPTPPNRRGTRASGIAVATDSLCYRSWQTIARTSAHTVAAGMGLFRNVEPDGLHVDPIGDSDREPENLMFFAEFGGIILSDGQAEVLRRYPGLR